MATDTMPAPPARLAARSQVDVVSPPIPAGAPEPHEVPTSVASSGAGIDVHRVTVLPHTVGNLRMMQVLERIAGKFSEARVPLLALKGAALNLTLYDRPDARPMADLDLMIRPRDAERASAILEGMGGLRGEPLVREDFFPRFHYEFEYVVGSIYPVRIDLHVRPFRPLRYARLVPRDAFWDTAETVAVGRATVLIPSTEDMLIHLAGHAAVHGCPGGKWLEDIDRWSRCYGERIDWERFLGRVQGWGLVLPVRTALARVEREYGSVCPAGVARRLSEFRVGWANRLTLWQAPRDAGHPAAHVTVNVLCAPGWRFKLAYLAAILMPGKAHMADWYAGRHLGWLPCAHVLRWLDPFVSWFPRRWRWFTKIEIRPSPIHGIGVFATRDIRPGEAFARYSGKKVAREGVYVVTHKARSGGARRYELTGKLKHLNHSCRPNARIAGFELVAIRWIRGGQEVTIDYGVGACDCIGSGEPRAETEGAKATA